MPRPAPSVLLWILLAQGAAGPPPPPSGEVTWARGFEGQRKADLGNGSFLNPILAGDHPDPSVLRDGDDYYMTFSSFDAYPGLLVWHSRDLVNWQPVGPALFTNVGSVWAPDLVKHRDRYYIYFPGQNRDRPGASSNYVIWAGPHRRSVERTDRFEDRPDRSGARRRGGRQAVPGSSAAASGRRFPTTACASRAR
jgi:hypothetical protein